MESKYCIVCDCLIYSESKRCPVMCECQWKANEKKLRENIPK